MPDPIKSIDQLISESFGFDVRWPNAYVRRIADLLDTLAGAGAPTGDAVDVAPLRGLAQQWEHDAERHDDRAVAVGLRRAARDLVDHMSVVPRAVAPTEPIQWQWGATLDGKFWSTFRDEATARAEVARFPGARALMRRRVWPWEPAENTTKEDDRG